MKTEKKVSLGVIIGSMASFARDFSLPATTLQTWIDRDQIAFAKDASGKLVLTSLDAAALTMISGFSQSGELRGEAVANLWNGIQQGFKQSLRESGSLVLWVDGAYIRAIIVKDGENLSVPAGVKLFDLTALSKQYEQSFEKLRALDTSESLPTPASCALN